MASDTLIDCVLGLDISTSIIGISCVTCSGEILSTDSLILQTNKLPTIWDKSKKYQDTIRQLKEHFTQNRLRIKKISVEEAFKSFSAGRSSSDTISLLQQFNGIVCWITSQEFDLYPTRMNVATARKLVGYKRKYYSVRYPDEKEKELVFRWGLSQWGNRISWGQEAAAILEENEILKCGQKGIKKNWYDEMDSCVIAIAGCKQSNEV